MHKRIIAFVISFFLIFEQSGFAQVAGQMQVPGYLANLLPADNFSPIQLRSVVYDPALENFRLMLDKGDRATASTKLNSEASVLWNYFLIGLRLPNSMLWVNLRPDSPRDVIDPNLEKTDVGKILLAADLQLKKDMARFTSPDTADGRQYWEKVYAKAEQLYGQADMEIPTITRPWIVPGEVIIKETDSGAYIYKATLNVMLEQDYLKDSPFYSFSDPKQKEMNAYSSELIRNTILPRLVREVNSSKRYAELRQVYYSVVLAQWFKQRLQGRADGLAAKIDSKDLAGLTSSAAWSKDTYYNEYKKSFSQGEYNKEESIDTPSGLTVRTYFSGGAVVDVAKAQSVTAIRALTLGQSSEISFNATDGGITETVAPIQSKGAEVSDNDLKQLTEQNREIFFGATKNANYILHEQLIHPAVSEEILSRVDGAVLGSEMDTFSSGDWFHPFDFVDQYDHFSTGLTNALERARKPLFYADLPVHEFLGGAFGPAGISIGAKGFAATLGPLVVLMVLSPAVFGPVLIAEFFIMTARLLGPGLKEDPRVKSVLGYLKLATQFYTPDALRSAVTANKIEEIIVPRLKEEILQKEGVERKPNILISYGDGYRDIVFYAQHKWLRKAVIALNTPWFFFPYSAASRNIVEQVRYNENSFMPDNKKINYVDEIVFRGSTTKNPESMDGGITNDLRESIRDFLTQQGNENVLAILIFKLRPLEGQPAQYGGMLIQQGNADPADSKAFIDKFNNTYEKMQPQKTSSRSPAIKLIGFVNYNNKDDFRNGIEMLVTAPQITQKVKGTTNLGSLLLGAAKLDATKPLVLIDSLEVLAKRGKVSDENLVAAEIGSMVDPMAYLAQINNLPRKNIQVEISNREGIRDYFRELSGQTPSIEYIIMKNQPAVLPLEIAVEVVLGQLRNSEQDPVLALGELLEDAQSTIVPERTVEEAIAPQEANPGLRIFTAPVVIRGSETSAPLQEKIRSDLRKQDWRIKKARIVEKIYNLLKDAPFEGVIDAQKTFSATFLEVLTEERVNFTQSILNEVLAILTYDLSTGKWQNAAAESKDGGNRMSYVENYLRKQGLLDTETGAKVLSLFQKLDESNIAPEKTESIVSWFVDQYGWDTYTFTLGMIQTNANLPLSENKTKYRTIAGLFSALPVRSGLDKSRVTDILTTFKNAAIAYDNDQVKPEIALQELLKGLDNEPGDPISLMTEKGILKESGIDALTKEMNRLQSREEVRTYLQERREAIDTEIARITQVNKTVTAKEGEYFEQQAQKLWEQVRRLWQESEMIDILIKINELDAGLLEQVRSIQDAQALKLVLDYSLEDKAHELGRTVTAIQSIETRAAREHNNARIEENKPVKDDNRVKRFNDLVRSLKKQAEALRKNKRALEKELNLLRVARSNELFDRTTQDNTKDGGRMDFIKSALAKLAPDTEKDKDALAYATLLFTILERHNLTDEQYLKAGRRIVSTVVGAQLWEGGPLFSRDNWKDQGHWKEYVNAKMSQEWRDDKVVTAAVDDALTAMDDKTIWIRYNEAFNRNSWYENVESTVRKLVLNALLEYEQQRASGNSAAQSKDGGTKGGIDLRAVPMQAQPGMGLHVPTIDMRQLQLLAERSTITDLDKEWVEIQKQMKGKQMPYARMKEYVAVCFQRKADEKHMSNVAVCVTNILKLEEKCAVTTSPEMKELLVMIEATHVG